MPSDRAWAGPWRTVSTPSSRIDPLSGWWTPARILTSVLLPAPFSPTSAWTSPATQLERDVVERLRRGEPLRDAAQLGARGGAATVSAVIGGPVVARMDEVPGGAVGATRRTSMPRVAKARDHRGRALASSVSTTSMSSVGQNVANAARSHLVLSTIAMTSRAAATIERLICASSSVASLRPDSMREPGRPDERLLDVDPAEQPIAQLTDDRQRLPADPAAEHQRP